MGVNLTQVLNETLKVEIVGSRKSDVIEYGVRWVVGQSSPVGERVKRVNGELFVGAATNLVANVGVDSQIVVNSFDNIDIFITEQAAVSGNILIKRKLYFHKLEFVKEGEIEYEYSWMCEIKLPGYIRPRIFIDDNGEDIDFAYLGKYEASEDASGKARSTSGVFPKVTISALNARKAARKNDGDGDNTDSRWGIMDLAEYQYHIVVPFEIEFATRHSQSVLVGVTNLPFSNDHVALTTETDSNIIILAKAHAASFVVGQTVNIGTNRDSSNVALNVIIQSIEVDTPIEGQSKITFSGSPITVSAGDVISSRAWISGATNGVIASGGAFTANSAKYPIVYRGYENPYGNIYKIVDGVKIYDHKLWVCEDRSAYNNTNAIGGEFAAPYYPVSYVNAKTTDYIKKLGYDKLFPYARLPIEVGGAGTGASAYYADYYYQDVGNRMLFVGGVWNDGSLAGLFYWRANYSVGSGGSDYLGFRLSYRPLKGVY